MSEFLAETFDILLMGDMFFDENLGGKLSNLAKSFKETCPKSKMVLIGDPGRWLLSEKKMKHPHSLQCLAKYDLGTHVKKDHYGLLSGFVYQVL